MVASTLKNAFGINCRVDEIKLKGLPLYLTSGRKIYRVTMGEISFLLVKTQEGERFGAVALKKQLAVYGEKSGLNVAFCLDSLTRVQRDALVSKEIPFISLTEQIYLPFLGVILNNNFKKRIIVNADKMMPATQCLFLYLLYHGKEEYVIKKQAADDLGLTRTSITRASEQLVKMNLISEEKHGKEVRMIMPNRGFEYYKMARPYLVNPIQSVIYVESPGCEDFFYSGETALSNNSLLARPIVVSYAIYKGNEQIKSFKEVDPIWQQSNSLCRMELWKYDPALFARKGEVDPVSLVMSLLDNEDERVQGELQRYLEEYKW